MKSKELIKGLRVTQLDVPDECVVRCPTVDGDHAQVVADISEWESGHKPTEVAVTEFFDETVGECVDSGEWEREAHEQLRDGVWVDTDDQTQIVVIVDP